MERNQTKELVFQYIDARLASDEKHRLSETARVEAAKAENDMQDAWRRCRQHKIESGVYSFKEHGRIAVVVSNGDYPALTRIVP